MSTQEKKQGHSFGWLNAREREGLFLASRRGMLKASIAGIGGLTLPNLLQLQEAKGSGATSRRKSVILLWMAGGPSHIDTLDPKPLQPPENRGPFGTISTKIPGVAICEYLPKLATNLDKFTVVRSVDARHSNHEPNQVFQTANLAAEPRTNPKAERYPAIASVVAKYADRSRSHVPPYVAFMRSRSHLAFAGYLGKEYDPFIADQAAKLPVYDLVGNDTGKLAGGRLFDLPRGLDADRIHDRQSLLKQFDRIRCDLDQDGSMAALTSYSSRAVQMVTSNSVRDAFDVSLEPDSIRQLYGSHLWCQQALLARRLVQAGVSFITIDLSYHTASGTWDTHGDNIPPYGGIWNGLRPLLPLFDHLITTLIADLERCGELENTLVLAMGEFGRTPKIGTQGSSDGRDHWPEVMSMLMAGGGLRHGQVIGATERDGGHIQDRAVTPGDLASTIFKFMDVPLDVAYEDDQQRPTRIIENGRPIHELF